MQCAHAGQISAVLPGDHVPDICRHVRAVTAQGRTLKVKNTARHYAWRFDDGAYIQTTWERYKPGLGNTITIQTGESLLSLSPAMGM